MKLQQAIHGCLQYLPADEFVLFQDLLQLFTEVQAIEPVKCIGSFS